MYYPIQIPYLLNKSFSEHIHYSEEFAENCGGFVVCFWSMVPLSDQKLIVNNIIAADACIDLVVNFDEKDIAFAGMRKTAFDFPLSLPFQSFGARMMPGAFYQLTGIPATNAMDTLLPIEEVYPDFDRVLLFSLPFDKSKEYFKVFLAEKTKGKTPDIFTDLFHKLSVKSPSTAKALYEMLNFSPRQCQRLFAKHYGIAPKMALSIVRFQKCLEMLTSSQATPVDILSAVHYYDQPHLINDFKHNMGITPQELIHIYRS